MKDIAATLLSFSVSFLPVTAMLMPVLLIAAGVIYLNFRITPDGSRRSIIQFALRGLAVGSVAGFLGMGTGIAFFCSYSLGNLCGLGGVFFSGPLAFSLAVIAYLFVWARNGKAL
ncbi:MAG: hypothetical protein ACREVH_09215 [Gammaproteobacteria bacterium]